MKTVGLSILGVVSGISAIIGIVCFFIGHPIVTVICGLITILNTIVQAIVGERDGFGPEIIVGIIGAAIGWLLNCSILSSALLALCFWDMLISSLGIVSFILIYVRYNGR